VARYSSGVKVNPSGERILSWTTLFAISPPFSSATAPTMAYSDVMRTDSMPEPGRSSACTTLAYRASAYQEFIRTLFGVHLVTLSRPYRSASCDNRALSRTLLSASSDNPCSPFNAGCRKGLRPYSSSAGSFLLSLGHWFSCGEFMSACEVCSSTIRRPEYFCQCHRPFISIVLQTYPGMPDDR
jgi:hypothetical protein